MKPKFRLLGDEYDVTPIAGSSHLTLAINDRCCDVSAHSVDGDKQRFEINGQTFEATIARDGDDIFIHLDGDVWHLHAIDPIDAAGGGVGTSDAIIAPMPGVIVSCTVTVGEHVSRGQTMMVIESMKLQTSIIADRDGTIQNIQFTPGDTFDKSAELLRFDPEDHVAKE